MRDTASQLAAMLRKERKRRGLSLREAQASCGVAFNTIARFEAGTWPKRGLRVMAKLADWCGYDLVLVPREKRQ